MLKCAQDEHCGPVREDEEGDCLGKTANTCPSLCKNLSFGSPFPERQEGHSERGPLKARQDPIPCRASQTMGRQASSLLARDGSILRVGHPMTPVTYMSKIILSETCSLSTGNGNHAKQSSPVRACQTTDDQGVVVCGQVRRARNWPDWTADGNPKLLSTCEAVSVRTDLHRANLQKAISCSAAPCPNPLKSQVPAINRNCDQLCFWDLRPGSPLAGWQETCRSTGIGCGVLGLQNRNGHGVWERCQQREREKHTSKA